MSNSAENTKKRLICILAMVFASPAFSITDEEVEAKKKELIQSIDGRTEEERRADAEVMKRYEDAIVIDALIPGTPEGYVEGTIADYEAMVARSRDYQFDAVSYTAAVDDTYEVL